MKYIGAFLFAAYTLFAAAAAVHAEEQRIAIVASERSAIAAISAKEARRAYLGASVVLNGVEIMPLLNQSDKLAGEVFMQKVMFMSAEAFQRQLLSRTFRGGRGLKSYESFTDLIDALRNDNAAITFMLYQTALNTPGIRIIGNL